MFPRKGEMIAYQSYNAKSPLDGEAARRVDENLDRLPLDPVNMMVDEPEPAATGKPKSPSPSLPAKLVSGSPAPIHLQCPARQARYRLPAGTAAKQARGKHCQTVFEVPPESTSS